MGKTQQQMHYCPTLDMQVQEQVGEAALPLVVEFTPTRHIQSDNKLAMQMAKDFISTLAIFQKDYSGLVLALTCQTGREEEREERGATPLTCYVG
jgi:hypothetical protein